VEVTDALGRQAQQNGGQELRLSSMPVFVRATRAAGKAPQEMAPERRMVSASTSAASRDQ
jgi:hypothetical protein